MRDESATPLRRPPWSTSWADCRQSGLAASFQNNAFWGDANELWPGRAPEGKRGDEFWHPGFVSLWIGSFPNEAMFDWFFADIEAAEFSDEREGDELFSEELFTPLWDELGFRLSYSKLQFQYFRETIPVPSLVDRLPHADYVRGQLLASSQVLGIDAGNAVLAFFNFDYFGLRTLARGHLQFVGSARYA